MVKSKFKDWLKFISGILLLIMVIGFFSSGITPPGVFGEVLRHNMNNDIDASPLFYSDLENMAELEKGVQEMRYQAELRMNK
jgi:hypothetical protein